MNTFDIVQMGKTYLFEYKYNFYGAKYPAIEIQRVLNSLARKLAGSDQLPYYVTQVDYNGLQYVDIYVNPNLPDKTVLNWSNIFKYILTTGEEKIFDKMEFVQAKEKEVAVLTLEETALNIAKGASGFLYGLIALMALILLIVYYPQISMIVKGKK